ncbi:hypothetical protein L2E82_49049 [Cichorium intybus]|uniref:Uncharacterized protein n=1 Tax=Cichorium intybus TaxID=13427 RepID=A0ACB8YZQ2_CICIN|nr:hypothetical protein L2E82_49049 [Cichorium intybus]
MTPEANFRRFTQVLESEEYKKLEYAQEINDVDNIDELFNFPHDPKDWKEKDLKEYWAMLPDGSMYEGIIWDDLAHGKGVYEAEQGLVRLGKGRIFKRDFMSPEDKEWLDKDIEDCVSEWAPRRAAVGRDVTVQSHRQPLLLELCDR